MKMNQKEFLRLCAKANRFDIEKAIQEGASVNRRATYGGAVVPPLFVAVMECNLDAIEVLIKHKAKTVYGFIAAIMSDQKTLAKYMTWCGADINATDSHNRTPLLCAVSADNPKAVKWLIELGADVNMKVCEGYNVLTYAAFIFSDSKNKYTASIIKILMQAGSDYKEAVMAAIKLNNLELARLLVQNGADVREYCLSDRSPLSLALLNLPYGTDIKIFEFFLKNGAEPNEEFDFGDGIITTNLNLAVSMKNYQAVELLLRYGADPNIRDSKGRTALMYAVLTDKDVLDVLLHYGADPDICDPEGRTALMLSVIDGDSEDGIIQSLLEAGANPDIQDSKGQTALMWAVLDRDRSSEFLISALIRTGGLNIKEGVLWISAVALFTAAKREVQLDIIKNLIQYGANVSIRDNNGMNAFMCAMLNLDDEIADILKAAGTFELGVN